MRRIAMLVLAIGRWRRMLLHWPASSKRICAAIESGRTAESDEAALIELENEVCHHYPRVPTATRGRLVLTVAGPEMIEAAIPDAKARRQVIRLLEQGLWLQPLAAKGCRLFISWLVAALLLGEHLLETRRGAALAAFLAVLLYHLWSTVVRLRGKVRVLEDEREQLQGAVKFTPPGLARWQQTRLGLWPPHLDE